MAAAIAILLFLCVSLSTGELKLTFHCAVFLSLTKMIFYYNKYFLSYQSFNLVHNVLKFSKV